ncbi:hypothetical protein JTB14_001682 [Gonioctena quinquepunctata]|nr:hypothetical protein JTB14_001682 [Gonioctena quinquepunctata]
MTALDEMLTHIQDSLNKKDHIMGLFFDMRRAFDTVNHGLLENKLYQIGVRGPCLEWLLSYLSDRNQQVEINGVRSDPIKTHTGTPQGSCIAIPHIVQYIYYRPSKTITIKWIPDYLCLIISGKSDQEIQGKSQKSIKTISKWCSEIMISLNTDKSVAVQFYTKNINDG